MRDVSRYSGVDRRRCHTHSSAAKVVREKVEEQLWNRRRAAIVLGINYRSLHRLKSSGDEPRQRLQTSLRRQQRGVAENSLT